jgi:glycosyltransferase involved in cell wall biosynthesis
VNPSTPEVTILLTVYNGAQWIRDALRSALEQERVAYEILVIDDGSTDDTAAIATEVATENPSAVRVKAIPRSGLSAARNVGFDEARGEFITVIDADDLMHPLRCWCEVEGLRRYPDAVICFSKRWSFRDEDSVGVLRFQGENLVGENVTGYAQIHDPITALIRAGAYPGTSACTSRRDFSRGPGRYDELQPSFVDGELWIRTMHDRSAVYCGVPLYFRRVHDQSWSLVHPTRLANVRRALAKARSHWSDYSDDQQRALEEFERRVLLGTAEGWIRAGRRVRAASLLIRHWRNLRGRRWGRAIRDALIGTRGGEGRRDRGGPGAGDKHRIGLDEILSLDVDDLIRQDRDQREPSER